MIARTPGHDVNGLEIDSVLARFSEDEIDAARRLAKRNGHRHDLIGTDPANAGWRFLCDARVALGGKDPGRSPYQDLARQNRQARINRRKVAR